jgi:hypothetical protein
MPLHECERLLADLASGVGYTYLVFDGIDESDHRRTFLQSIRNMARSCQFRLLIMSRPYIRDLTDLFQQYPTIRIEAHKEDLKIYLY